MKTLLPTRKSQSSTPATTRRRKQRNSFVKNSIVGSDVVYTFVTPGGLLFAGSANEMNKHFRVPVEKALQLAKGEITEYKRWKKYSK